MLVLAGPGSGKTRVLTERIRVMVEEENIAPESILVITFSKKAANEMQQRFIKSTNHKSYPVIFGTFHGFFYQILKSHRKYSNISIITTREKQKYICEIGEALGIDRASYLSWQNKIISQISLAKNDFKHRTNANKNRPNDDTNDINSSDEDRLLYDIMSLYGKRCIREDKIDFDDILLLTYELLDRDENILSYWKQIIKYVLIDEFQDINDIQYEIISLLVKGRNNIFCVGDDDQSIYEFRGAYPGIMKKFLEDFSNATLVNLNINYRCAKNIIGAADTLINHNKNRIERKRQEVIDENKLGLVEIVRGENTILQANYVCDTIQEIVTAKKIEYKDIAVIYRSGHCAKMFKSVALKRAIPVTTKTEPFNILNENEIKIIISYLKISIGQGKRADFLLAINKPNRGISREAFSLASNDYIKEMISYHKENINKVDLIRKFKNDIDFINDLPPYAGIIYALYGVGLHKFFQKESIHNNEGNYTYEEIINMFLDLARGYKSIEEFIDYLEFANQQDDNIYKNIEESNLSPNSVNLLTAHASKGLEFDTVFIIGLQEGLFPHKKSLHGDSVEEERRLMYVAMTRAINSLYLCALDIEHGKSESRFIEEILKNQSFISSNSSLSRNSSKASATASYSSSSSI